MPRSSCNRCGGCFNSRTRERCDAFAPLFALPPRAFQLTHPRGVRHRVLVCLLVHVRFQLTHPREVRLPAATASVMGYKFQLTHPRGVRR